MREICKIKVAMGNKQLARPAESRTFRMIAICLLPVEARTLLCQEHYKYLPIFWRMIDGIIKGTDHFV